MNKLSHHPRTGRENKLYLYLRNTVDDLMGCLKTDHLPASIEITVDGNSSGKGVVIPQSVPRSHHIISHPAPGSLTTI